MLLRTARHLGERCGTPTGPASRKMRRTGAKGGSRYRDDEDASQDAEDEEAEQDTTSTRANVDPTVARAAKRDAKVRRPIYLVALLCSVEFGSQTIEFEEEDRCLRRTVGWMDQYKY